jgi:hypothetical protein
LGVDHRYRLLRRDDLQTVADYLLNSDHDHIYFSGRQEMLRRGTGINKLLMP